MKLDFDWQAAAEDIRSSGLSCQKFWEQRAWQYSPSGRVPSHSCFFRRIRPLLGTAQSSPDTARQGQRGNLRVVDMTTTAPRTNLQPANVRLLQPQPAPMRLMRLTLPNGTVMELQPEHPDELALKILDRVWGVQ